MGPFGFGDTAKKQFYDQGGPEVPLKASDMDLPLWCRAVGESHPPAEVAADLHLHGFHS